MRDLKKLPIGMSKVSGGNKGYRLHRTIDGNKYSLGTFQSQEHALRVNEGIDKVVKGYRGVMEERESLKGELKEIQKELKESNKIPIEEILKSVSEIKESMDLLNSKVSLIDYGMKSILEESIARNSSTFWNRIIGRR